MSDNLHIDSTVGGFKVSEFSESTLKLQNNFCHQDQFSKRYLKWFNNGPNVYLGSNNILNSMPFNLGKWSQEVKKFNSNTYTILSGNSIEFPVECSFIYIKVCWPNNSIESKKITEVFLEGSYSINNESLGDVILTREYDSPTQQKYLLKDFIILNLAQLFTGKVKLINNSPYNITYSVLECANFDIKDSTNPEPEPINFYTIYWGTTSKSELYESSDIVNLQSREKLKNINKLGNRETDAGVGEYLLYAFPQEWGLINFKVDGFSLVVSEDSPYLVNVTNPATGIQTPYNVWRSKHSNLGLTNVNTF